MTNEVNLRDEFYNLFNESSLGVTNVRINLEEMTMHLDFQMIEREPDTASTSDVLNIVSEEGVMAVVEGLMEQVNSDTDVEDAEFKEVEEEQDKQEES